MTRSVARSLCDSWASCSYTIAFDAPVRGSPPEYCHPVWCENALKWWVKSGEKSLRIYITVYTQYRRVTDRRTDILPLHSPRYAYASRGKNCCEFFAIFWQHTQVTGLLAGINIFRKKICRLGTYHSWPVCAGPLRAWSPATAFHGVRDSAGPARPDCYSGLILSVQSNQFVQSKMRNCAIQ